MQVFTLGHSTRSLDELIEILGTHQIQTLADIRRYPASRRYPHFSADSLGKALPGVGIRYWHFESLGGRRNARSDSHNTAWRNESFRGYADHMATPEFLAAVDDLLALKIPAVMCAEAVPWRCHRNLLSDELIRRGCRVTHILSKTSANEHQLSPDALEADGHLIYLSPNRQPPLPFLR